MAEPDDSPSLRTRALGLELRRIRQGLKLTLEQVEEALNQSSGWLSRIETGKRKMPHVNQVTMLLDHYGITDEATRNALLALTKRARARGWWSTYKDTVPETYLSYVNFEAGAHKIYTATPAIVPGLLQTADYARAVIGSGGLRRGLTVEQVESRVEVRGRRQQLLTRENPVALRAVIDESALSRVVGGPKVMREQLEFLLGIAEQPNVTIQIVPLSVGAHAAVTCGFTILEFDSDALDMVAIETLVGSLFIHEAAEVDPHVEAFRDLHSSALSEPDSLTMIAAAKAEY